MFVPISGWTADRLGARRVFSAAIVVFTLGSIGCGLSNSLPMLVVSRIVQGMGGAMMVPVGRLVLLKTVPRSELVRAMSWVSVPALIGPVTGPPLGGFLATYASWRWIFFINIPIGVLGVVLVNLFIEDFRDSGRRPFDLPGFVLTGVGLASLAFGFETVGRGAVPWAVTVALMAVGLICLTAYVRHARRVEFPVIDLSAAAHPDLCRGDGRRFSVPHGAGRVAVSAAADAADRVRPERAEFGSVDLRQRRRSADDEDGR